MITSWKTIAAMLAMATMTACATDGAENADDGDPGTETPEITSYALGTYRSTTTMTAFDTGFSTSNSTCVLTSVFGDLAKGGDQENEDVPSEAWITAGSDGHWVVYAHGGAYTSTKDGTRVWQNNPVEAGVVCMPYRTSASAEWGGAGTNAYPVKIASLATNRRCFLSGLITGASAWTNSAASASIVDIEAGHTDSQHPTTGWYVQSTLPVDEGGDLYPSVFASCIDFPTIAGEAVRGIGQGSVVVTTGSDVKMCGLLNLSGTFNVDSYSNGVGVTAPSQTGNWTLTVSAGKTAGVDCID